MAHIEVFQLLALPEHIDHRGDVVGVEVLDAGDVFQVNIAVEPMISVGRSCRVERGVEHHVFDALRTPSGIITEREGL